MRGDTTLLHHAQPIADILEHPQVTDVVINRPEEVWFRQAGVWNRRPVPGFTFEMLDAMTILVGQRVGREFDEAHPYVNSTLPAGQRFQGVRPPGTKDGHMLWAIRRPPSKARRHDDPDFPLLFQETNTGTTRRQRAAGDIGSLFRNRDFVTLLPKARELGMSMAFCGIPGHGKSDMVRRMVQVHRLGVRQVTIQTDDEMGDAGAENTAALLYDDTQVSSDEAVRIALRLVPDEIALQEVRGAEAYSLLRVANTGMSVLTTWHADEGKELEALTTMARQHPSGREMDAGELKAMARGAFDIIAYCVRLDSPKPDEYPFRITSVRLLAAEQEAA